MEGGRGLGREEGASGEGLVQGEGNKPQDGRKTGRLSKQSFTIYLNYTHTYTSMYKLYIYSLNENFPSGLTMLSYKSHSVANKKPNSMQQSPYSELLARAIQQIPNITGYCHCPWPPPRGRNKFLLLKTLCTLDTGPRNSEWDLT